jgi:aminoglycoside 2''-phosphotransferase
MNESWMDKLTDYLRYISAACPGITIASAELHTTDGQFNDIVFINDDFIFRFPRTPEVAASYPSQATLLTYLHGKLPLPIPRPLYVAMPNVPWQQRFISYRRIPGQPLYRGTLAEVHDPTAIHGMATQLATFLRTLHHLAPQDLLVDLPVRDGIEQWEALYTGFRETLFPYMRPDACQWVTDHFDNYLRNPAQFTYRPVLRHGDFGGSNILYDPQTNCISGVIDFESLGLGDPATDVAALSTYGEEFFTVCLAAYPEMQTMLDRARFYRSTFALQEAYYGLRDNDQAAFQRGIADYV